MPNRRITVTLKEVIGIIFEVQSGWWRQDRDYVVPPEPLYKPRQQIVRNGIKDRLVAREITQIGQRRMRAIQHPELGMFEWSNIRYELNPSALPGRPDTVNESILQHPLPEWLMHDRCCIVKAGQPLDQR